MSDSSTLSFRVEDDIIDRLDDAAGQSNTSRSALARQAFLTGLQEMADGEGDVEIPEHLAHDAKTRDMIARNKRTRRQGKYRSEFSKQLKKSFKNNETPEEFRQSVAGYIEEARDLGEIPEGVREHIDSDASTYIEWVEDMLEYYRVAYESQNFEHDPIDDPLSNHEGIEHAREWVTRAENIAEADRDTALNIARHALSDGVVPEYVEQQAQENEGGVVDGVVEHAVDVPRGGSALTDSDTSEIED